MAKLNFLKNKASNTWPSEGTMHVDLPQGLEDVTHRTKLRKKSLKIPAIRSVSQLLLFSLAFWPHCITGVINEPVCEGKEEDPESLDVLLPKFKVERHEYFQT
jgi:hypothetical protein